MDGRHRGHASRRRSEEAGEVIEVAGKVIYNDGAEAEYRATQREFAAWERYALRMGMPTGTSGGAGSTAPITMTRYLAYSAMMRGDQEPISFEAWDAMVAEVSAEGDPNELDPTPPARSIDS